jgi:glucose/arabinose dehydrogenase
MAFRLRRRAPQPHRLQGSRARFYRAVAAGAALAAGFFTSPRAATLPAGFKETKLIGSINPTCVDVAPDGRVFLCEKSGRIRVYQDGKWLTAPLLTVDADYVEERGLLGLALDPDFARTPFVYVFYTAKNPAHNRVSRFRIEGDAAGSETVLLDLNSAIALRSGGWHNGGSIHFGKDGKLYVASGNNTIQANSQSLETLLGKVLRINPDGSIPEDNPFYKTATGNNRAIWALGLRNPYVTDVHPVTGRFLVHDVGDGSFEEINDGKAGTNYGYPKTEGHAGTAPAGLTGPYGDPISNYSHGDGCAITGGSFYHPASNTFGAEYADLYFFSDYCNGWIKTLNLADGNAVKAFATGIARPIFLKGAPDGSLYYTCRGARAAGLAAGSAEDNTSTADGSLYRVEGPVPTGMVGSAGAAGKGRDAAPVFLQNGRVLLPKGMHELALYDLAGARVWEHKRPRAEAATWLETPRHLPSGAYLMRSR